MATTCSNCNCTTSSCGCTTSSYTVVPPCPPACAEVFDSSCIVYTGTDIVCGSDTVISRNDYLDTVVTKIINYVCAQETGEDTYGIMTITDTDSGYTWTSTGSAVATDPEDTFTIVSGVGIDVDVDITKLAMRITNTANKYVTIAGTSGTTTASAAADTLTFDGNTGVTCAVTADLVTVSVLRWAKFTGDSGTATATGVADELTIAGGTGITTSVSGTTLTVRADLVKFEGPASVAAPGSGGTVSVTHNLNKTNVVLTLREASAGGVGYYAGVDYSITYTDNNSLVITDIGGGITGAFTYSVIG